MADDDQHAELIKEAFECIDNDGNGYITASELKTALQAMNLNPTDAEVEATIAEADKDMDSQISFDEFTKIWNEKYRDINATEQLEEAWDVFDTNNNGYLEREELVRYIKAEDVDIKEEELDEFMAAMDTNGDGKVAKQEFIDAIQNGTMPNL